jgi:hypothetical protein
MENAHFSPQDTDTRKAYCAAVVGGLLFGRSDDETQVKHGQSQQSVTGILYRCPQ